MVENEINKNSGENYNLHASTVNSDSNEPLLYMEYCVEGQEIKALVDTGASRNFISKSTGFSLGGHILSAYTKFSEKVTIFTVMLVHISWGKK